MCTLHSKQTHVKREIPVFLESWNFSPGKLEFQQCMGQVLPFGNKKTPFGAFAHLVPAHHLSPFCGKHHLVLLRALIQYRKHSWCSWRSRSCLRQANDPGGATARDSDSLDG